MIMKVPRLGRNQPAEGLISFETEANIVPALSGPHVPRFVAAGDLETTPYLVTEWIEGESLDAVLKRGLLRADQIQGIGGALADALHSLHRQDAIHLDVKPDNVILKPDGVAVLIDFGLAHHARYPDLLAHEKRFAAGSAPYVSPEQMLGTRSDPRSGIFALGVALYEMRPGAPFGIPRTMAGMRDACGWTPFLHARARPVCRHGCRRSSCAAWNRAPRRVTNRRPMLRSTCAIRSRSSSPRARVSPAKPAFLRRLDAGGLRAANTAFRAGFPTCR
jgi:serine/threonine protein kinase